MNGRGHLKSPWHISLSIFPIYEECRVNDYILESSLSYREVFKVSREKLKKWLLLLRISSDTWLKLNLDRDLMLHCINCVEQKCPDVHPSTKL